jgi:hypothetical protein
MFSEVIYDLDMLRIVDFTMKPCAERYLMLRASLYEAENGTTEPKNENAPNLKKPFDKERGENSWWVH